MPQCLVVTEAFHRVKHFNASQPPFGEVFRNRLRLAEPDAEYTTSASYVILIKAAPSSK